MTRIADIGAAVIGTGFIGTVHVEALRRIGVQVRGVLGSTPERGAARAEALGVPRAYASLDELLADPTVARRPRHLPERPPRPADAGDPRRRQPRRLREAAGDGRREFRGARRAGRRERPRQRDELQHPLLPAQPARPRAGRRRRLGDVRLVTGRYFQDWLLLESDWNWRLQPDRGGALRAVGDIGSHWLDLMTFVTGQHITEVMADLTTFIGTRHEPNGPGRDRSRPSAPPTPSSAPIATEDTATILLRFDGGARGAVSISQISPGRKNSLQYEIDGSESALAWDSEQPDQAWLGHRDRPNEILIRNPALMGPAGQAASALPGGHVEGFFDTFCAHFRAVYADVVAGAASSRPGYPTFADGHDEMLVGDAIARSAREGRWVDRRPARPQSSRPP